VEGVLSALEKLPKLTLAQRAQLQRARIAAVEKSLREAHGDEEMYLTQRLRDHRLGLISLLLAANDKKAAVIEWQALSAADREAVGPAAVIAIRIAAENGTLAALLEQYRRKPEQSPTVDALREAAVALRNEGHKEQVLDTLEYLYERELARRQFEPANFLGLAGVRLERGDTASAVALLRRMNLVAGAPFDTFEPAAELLAQFGKKAEASKFLEDRVRTVPWDFDAKLRLAKLGMVSNRMELLMTVGNDRNAVYAARVEAARLLAPRQATGERTELLTLEQGPITADQAEKPFYVAARLDAAARTSDTAVRLRLLTDALAIAPGDANVRLALTRAAVELRRDNLALENARRLMGRDAQFLSQFGMPDAERSAIAAQLAEAAERTDDLNDADRYVRIAVYLLPKGAERTLLEHKRETLEAEQQRLAANAIRQPLIKNTLEQATVVKTRIARSGR
jgi:hypothetical protein